MFYKEYPIMNSNTIIFQNTSREKHSVITIRMMSHLTVVPVSVLIAILVLTGPVLGTTISTATPPGMNLSIDPGEDFFSYANYHWIAEHPVPEDKKFYTAFEEVKDMVDSRVRTLVEEAASDYDAEKGTPRQLLGSFYRAALNDDSNARTGITPIQDELDEIAQASDRSEIRIVTSNLTARGLDPFFILYIDENPEKRKELIATIETGDFTIRFPPFYELEFDEAVRVQDLMKEYFCHEDNGQTFCLLAGGPV